MLTQNHDPSFRRALEEERSLGISIGMERVTKALVKRIDSGMFDSVEEVRMYALGVCAATIMNETNPEKWDNK